MIEQDIIKLFNEWRTVQEVSAILNIKIESVRNAIECIKKKMELEYKYLKGISAGLCAYRVKKDEEIKIEVHEINNNKTLSGKW